nr:hypothetical protein [Pseudomonas sp. HS-2]
MCIRDSPEHGPDAVSYTQLDVYKRQFPACTGVGGFRRCYHEAMAGPCLLYTARCV